ALSTFCSSAVLIFMRCSQVYLSIKGAPPFMQALAQAIEEDKDAKPFRRSDPRDPPFCQNDCASRCIAETGAPEQWCDGVPAFQGIPRDSRQSGAGGKAYTWRACRGASG